MDIKAISREATAIFMIVLAILVLVSLTTYSPEDNPDEHFTGQQHVQVQNKVGPLGNMLSHFLFRSIGLAGYVLVFFIFMWGTVLAFSKKELPHFWYRFIASLLLVFSVALFATLNTFADVNRHTETLYPFMEKFVKESLNLGDVGLGGNFGYVSAKTLVGITGKLGTEIIAIALMLITLEFSFGFLFSTLFMKLFKWSKSKMAEMREKSLAAKQQKDSTIADEDVEISSAPLHTPAPSEKDDKEPEQEEKKPQKSLKNLFSSKEDKPVKEKPKKGKEKKEKKEKKQDPKKDKKPVPPPKPGEYVLPSIDILEEPVKIARDGTEIHTKRAHIIEEVLRNFKIQGTVVSINPGPVITQFEIELGAGIRVNSVLQLSDNLSMALQSPGIRIEAPIPGKSTVGIEVPNKESEIVKLRDMMQNMSAKMKDAAIPLLLGKDTMGTPICGDLGAMPHMLIAGATGSGKTVCINSIILSILMLRKPEQVKLVIVDPKMVDMAAYKGIPHLLTPVVTDTQKAENVLNWAVTEMERRYKLFSLVGARDLKTYNKKTKEAVQASLEEAGNPPVYGNREVPFPMPYIVIIVDELADLMFASPKEIEGAITRIAQKARAAGIHLTLATQRPSVDVITGLIKSNIPCRIAFQVAAKVDSRTILDMNGAEHLLGKGDMLYLPPGTSKTKRAQGVYISDEEIRDVVDFCKAQAEPIFTPAVEKPSTGASSDIGEIDESLDDAIRVTCETQRGSASLLQRKLGVGYNRATKLVETMEILGIVGPYIGSKAREVMVTAEDYEEMGGLEGLLQKYESEKEEED